MFCQVRSWVYLLSYATSRHVFAAICNDKSPLASEHLNHARPASTSSSKEDQRHDDERDDKCQEVERNRCSPLGAERATTSIGVEVRSQDCQVLCSC